MKLINPLLLLGHLLCPSPSPAPHSFSLSLSRFLPSSESLSVSLCFAGWHGGKHKHSLLSNSTVLGLWSLEEDGVTPLEPKPRIPGSVCGGMGQMPMADSWLGRRCAVWSKNMSALPCSLWIAVQAWVVPWTLGKDQPSEKCIHHTEQSFLFPFA